MYKLSFIASIMKNLKLSKTRFILFSAAIVSTIGCAIASYLHYSKIYNDSPFAWIGWVSGMLFILAAFAPTIKLSKEVILSSRNVQTLVIFLSTALLFFSTHLWNFDTAPWNNNGLFDDAAWDVHFVIDTIQGPAPFQAAFFSVSSAREVVYHYFLIPFFEILGYNLLSYVIALLVLGFFTVFFTTLLIHRLFNNSIITAISAVALNFLPLHYLHTFVGHRYAIVAPLLMGAVYFLYTGVSCKSYFRITISAIMGGLCFTSAIMGKQIHMALIGAIILHLIFNFKKSFTMDNWNNVKVFVIGTLISSMPMLFYVLFNQNEYFFNESGYTKQFLEKISTTGMAGFMEHYKRMTDCLFGTTWYKWFIPDYPIIPVAYYLLLIPGIIIAFLKKYYSYVILVLLAPAGAFVAGFSDYRVLHTSPFWIILMAFTLNEIANIDFSRFKGLHLSASSTKYIRLTGLIVATVIVLTGLFPSIKYIDGKSRDPYSVWFFAQKDVASSRYLRDIVAGVPNPSTEMRPDEFKKLPGYKEPSYDTLICQKLGYAITHLFLHDYDSKKIMSFSDQLPYNLLEEAQIFEINKSVIQSYRKNTKDLKLIWEVSDKTQRIIEKFKPLSYFGSDENLSSGHSGQSFEFYVLNIKNENIDEFKQKASELVLN
ncbi:MAG: hypothetical protein GX660_01465 [Clostridiaceae bacterium]|nr:hypothetical protein [Clostridiaceae bacterium]